MTLSWAWDVFERVGGRELTWSVSRRSGEASEAGGGGGPQPTSGVYTTRDPWPATGDPRPAPRWATGGGCCTTVFMSAPGPRQPRCSHPRRPRCLHPTPGILTGSFGHHSLTPSALNLSSYPGPTLPSHLLTGRQGEPSCRRFCRHCCLLDPRKVPRASPSVPRASDQSLKAISAGSQSAG